MENWVPPAPCREASLQLLPLVVVLAAGWTFLSTTAAEEEGSGDLSMESMDDYARGDRSASPARAWIEELYCASPNSSLSPSAWNGRRSWKSELRTDVLRGLATINGINCSRNSKCFSQVAARGIANLAGPMDRETCHPTRNEGGLSKSSFAGIIWSIQNLAVYKACQQGLQRAPAFTAAHALACCPASDSLLLSSCWSPPQECAAQQKSHSLYETRKE